MSPELETLDQLIGGDMPLSIIRGLHPDDDSLKVAVHRMLQGGDVVLLDEEGAAIPYWRSCQILDQLDNASVTARYWCSLTPLGARKIT